MSTAHNKKQFVLATGNQGKVKELADVLAPFDVDLLPQSAPCPSRQYSSDGK